jgi:hypothetical protein
MAAATGTDQQLAWEARQRPRAALAAFAAAIFTLGSAIASGLLFADIPDAPWLESARRATQPGPVGQLESLRTVVYEFYDDKAAAVIGTALARGLGYVALGWVLTFLASATRARRPELPKVAVYLGLIGALLSAIAFVLSAVATVTAVNDFLAGPRTVDTADEVLDDSLLLTAQFIGLPGAMALALGLVLVCLNAMRAGLLTRFMGVLGIIVGVLVIFPIGSPLPIVQCFWLVALGVLILGHWPNGTPAAWRTGRAEPWPSQAELRAERQREMARRRGQRGPEAPAPAENEEPVAVAAGPASKKRKRKRRGQP